MKINKEKINKQPKFLVKKKGNTNKNKRYNKFNLIFLLSAFFPLFSVGGFNLLIDPYGLYNAPKITGINKYKSEQISYDRIFQAIEITKRKPNVIFLGASTTQFGLYPRYFPDFKSENVYNIGLQNANIYEVNQYFKHALVNNPDIKKVVLGLDLFMFEKDKQNNPNFSLDRLEKKGITTQDILNTLFSFSSLNPSWKTIINNRNGTASYYEYINGMLKYDNGEPTPGNLDKFTNFLKITLKKTPEHKFSQQRLDYFKEIVTICKEKNIELKVFISPSHAMQYTAIYTVGDWYWSEWENWKRELVKISRIWDFSGYNSITTEPISNDMKYYVDSTHYKSQVSKIIFAKIFENSESKSNPDFGFLLTPENVENSLSEIHKQRDLWMIKNPESVKIITNLQNKNN